MSDKSPEETPGLDESTPAETEATQPERDDAVIEAMEEDLPADETTEETGAPAAVRRKTAKAPVKKSEATRRRASTVKEHVDPYRAKNPAHFVRQSAGELKKVHWPTRSELGKSFVAVLIFVLFIIAFVSLWDALFGWALLNILGT